MQFMNTENLLIQIKTFFGLEEVLAAEIKKLGGTNVEVKNRAVNCEGDLGFLYKINYYPLAHLTPPVKIKVSYFQRIMLVKYILKF